MGYVASGTLAEDSGSGGNVTPGLPAGIVAGDILVLVISAADNVVCTLPGAYTKKLENNSGATGRQTIAWARATGSDSAPLVTHAAGNAIGARIHAYRGCVASGDPFSATSANAQSQGTGTTLTATTITPANLEFTLMVASYFDNITSNFPDTLSGWSGSNPTLTERTDDSTNGLNTAGWGMGIADGTSNGSATGSRTATLAAGMSAAGTSVNSLLSLVLAVGSVAVITPLVPKLLGPTSRAFHMLQRIPTVPVAPVVTPAPFALLDWPNMWARPNPIETRTVTDASEFWMLRDTFFGAEGQPPANLDRPIPRGRPYPLSTWIVSLNQLAGRDTFFGAAGQPPANLDWPNPTRSEVPSIDLRSWLQSLKQNLLGQDQFFGAAGMGPKYDYPNPLTPRPSSDLRTHIWDPLTTLLNVVISVPFAFFDWIVPKAKRPSDQGYTDSSEIWMLKDTFYGAPDQPPSHEWVNPRGAVPAIDLRTWITNIIETTLGILASPFAQLVWPNPKAPKPSITLLTANDPTKLLLRGQDTFFGAAGEPPHYDWPNPIPARRNVTLFGFIDWLKKVLPVISDFPGRIAVRDFFLGSVTLADTSSRANVLDIAYGRTTATDARSGFVDSTDLAAGRVKVDDKAMN